MSSRTRATVIGLLGPGISALGILWTLLRAALDSTPEKANLRFFLFDSPHLVVAIGVAVSVLCLPVAIHVALSRTEEVTIPVFDADLVAEPAEASPGDQPKPLGVSPK